MKGLLLTSVAALALGCSSALAGSSSADLHPSRTHVALPHQLISDNSVDADGAFGAALEDAMTRPQASRMLDPTGKFSIQVGNDGGGRVIRVVALQTNHASEWRMGSGSGDQVVQATLTEIMAAVGQHQKPGLMSAGPISAQRTK